MAKKLPKYIIAKDVENAPDGYLVYKQVSNFKKGDPLDATDDVIRSIESADIINLDVVDLDVAAKFSSAQSFFARQAGKV